MKNDFPDGSTLPSKPNESSVRSGLLRPAFCHCYAGVTEDFPPLLISRGSGPQLPSIVFPAKIRNHPPASFISRFTLSGATFPFCGSFSQKSVKYFWRHMKDAHPPDHFLLDPMDILLYSSYPCELGANAGHLLHTPTVGKTDNRRDPCGYLTAMHTLMI